MIEVRIWNEECRVPGLTSPPPDTIAYPPGRRSELQVRHLGGCIDSVFYRYERQFYAALDSLGLTDSSAVWPFEPRLRVEISELDGLARPEPVTDGVKVFLFEPQTTFYAAYSFSPQYGLLWGEVHQGPSFQIDRVERSTGEVVNLRSESPAWLFEDLGPPSEDVQALLDSLDRLPPAPPPPPPQ